MSSIVKTTTWYLLSDIKPAHGEGVVIWIKGMPPITTRYYDDENRRGFDLEMGSHFIPSLIYWSHFEWLVSGWGHITQEEMTNAVSQP